MDSTVESNNGVNSGIEQWNQLMKSMVESNNGINDGVNGGMDGIQMLESPAKWTMESTVSSTAESMSVNDVQGQHVTSWGRQLLGLGHNARYKNRHIGI